MKLSVVVPVYNVIDYLGQCIESILSQSYKDIELLLVDDGSSDGSERLCDEYARRDKRVKVFHKENTGPMLSRKLGVEKAEGEYITFVDADDFVCEKSFELALKDMQKGIDVISFGIVRYFAQDRMSVTVDFFSEGLYSAEMIEKNIFPSMVWNAEKDSYGMDPSLCSKMIKRDLLKKQYQVNISTESFHYGEDMAIVYPLMLNVNTLSVHYEAYYYHRQRESSCVAPYIADAGFFDKLHILYRYMVDTFAGNDIFQKQIDLFYIKSVMVKGKQYGKFWNSPDKVFPFDKIPKGKKIVLYGAGNIGKLYRAQLKAIDYCKLVLWVDKNHANLKDENITNPEDILKYEFDYVVIAIMHMNSAKDAAEWMQMNGIPAEKIISNFT